MGGLHNVGSHGPSNSKKTPGINRHTLQYGDDTRTLTQASLPTVRSAENLAQHFYASPLSIAYLPE